MGNVITGTDLAIDVGKNYKGKLNIYGKTEQVTRSGKNKFDRNKVRTDKPDNIKLNTTGITLTNCWATEIMTNENIMKDLESNKTYTCIAKVKCVSKPTTLKESTNHERILMFYSPNASGSQQMSVLAVADKNNWVVGTTYECRKVFNTPEDLTGYNLVAYNYYGNDDGSTTYVPGGSFEITDLMIVEGDVTDEEFELYGASPSPEFPSEIENVEGKNKLNLRDTAEAIIPSNEITYSVFNQRLTINGTGLSSKYPWIVITKKGIYSKNGTPAASDITTWANGNIAKGIFKPSKKILSGSSTSNFSISLYDETGKNVTSSLTNDTNIVAVGIYLGEAQTFTNCVLGVQLEEGTVSTEYVPYNSLVLKVTGKNWFNKEKDFSYTNIQKSEWTITQIDNGLRIKSNYSEGYPFVRYVVADLTNHVGKTVRAKANLVASGDNIGRYMLGLCDYDGSNGVSKIYSDTNGREISFVVSEAEERKYLFLNLYLNGRGTGQSPSNYVDYTNIIITIDDEDMSYEPHQQQTAYFPLSEGQKLMEGSYLADDGVHNKRSQIVLDGSETWSKDDNKDETVDYFYIKNVGISKDNIDSVYCSHFSKGSSTVQGFWATTVFCITINKEYTGIISTDTKDERVAKFKAWLSNNPTTVEYELVEEEIVPYTAEQQEAWNQIQNIYLFEGKNYFNNINKLKSDLELEYLKIVDDDTDFYISENGRLVIPEYDINYLIDFSASNIPSMPEAMEAAVRVVGKDGDIPLNTTYEPIPFSIVCYTDDNLTPDEKVREEQKINRFMDSIKNKTKVLGFERENKFYDVKYNGVLTTVRFPAHVQFTIPVKSSESYAKDLIKKRIQGNGSENSETIKEVGAVFTIRGPAQTPKISFNNYHMEFDEVLLENTELIIDSNKSTATHVNHTLGVKTNVMKYYNHEFPKVRFGENVLAINSGINDISQVKVEWNDLKL